MLQSAGHLLQNMKTFPEFTAELSQRVSSDSEYLDLIKNREFDKALLLNLQIFNDFVTYAKRPKISVLSEKPESQMSRFSEIDQEIHDQRRLFSEICKDIGNSLSPESLESDYDDA